MSETTEIIPINLSDADIETKKILACSINLGARMVSELIGDNIGKPQDIEEGLPELIASALLSELVI